MAWRLPEEPEPDEQYITGPVSDGWRRSVIRALECINQDLEDHHRRERDAFDRWYHDHPSLRYRLASHSVELLTGVGVAGATVAAPVLLYLLR